MHKVVIPDHILACVIKSQGRWNVHDDVPPAETAFVVVDMQNYFKGGQHPCDSQMHAGVEAPTVEEGRPGSGSV
jgi:hypothetical protein